MSTLTDSDDARRECCRDTASAAATIARLTRERDEARAQVDAVLALCKRAAPRHGAAPWIHVDDIRRALEAPRG